MDPFFILFFFFRRPKDRVIIAAAWRTIYESFHSLPTCMDRMEQWIINRYNYFLSLEANFSKCVEISRRRHPNNHPHIRFILFLLKKIVNRALMWQIRANPIRDKIRMAACTPCYLFFPSFLSLGYSTWCIQHCEWVNLRKKYFGDVRPHFHSSVLLLSSLQ